MPLPVSSPAAPTHQLTDREWRGIERLLPLPSPRGRPFADRQSVMTGVVWQFLTSCPWRAVPRQYAPWQTCYHYRRELDRLGVWPEIVRALELVPGSLLTGTAGKPASADMGDGYRVELLRGTEEVE
ncbi:transposase [Deinococcus koreensis]